MQPVAISVSCSSFLVRCCDNSGEVSESQKQELEQYQATVKRQEAELVEVRQQLAKLSEIVDRQTDDMKQLNLEARFAIDFVICIKGILDQLGALANLQPAVSNH